ncbi:MAG: hypothetical protein NTY07_21230 [Bacteroidia bacterium]|nr:hypothetical protein [Bacteroidia bacterium]
MDTNSIEPTPENNKESKPMTRAEALKKAGKLTLAAGTMLVLLNTPEKALAQSAPPPP